MEALSSGVRIVLLEPPRGSSVAAALRRLGRETRVEILHDLEVGVRSALAGDVDLVVVDVAWGDSARAAVETLHREGPPVLVVGEGFSGEEALAWFRAGASDCVALSGDGRALAAASLELVRRWRALRERGAALRRILDLERYSEDVIDNMNSAVLVAEPDGRIVSANAAAAHILGRSLQELRGESVLEWFPDESGRGVVARTLAEGIRFKGTESVFTRADGARVPVGISCAPIYASGGELRGAVATFQDLSEIQQLQRQVLQSEKMASIGQLAAGVAHEINNPMGFIHANLYQMAEYLGDLRRVWTQVEELRKCIGEGEREEVRAAAERLEALGDEVDIDFLLSDFAKAIRESQEGSERIRHIVQDLRDFSHQDTGEQTLSDVNQCLDSTANIVWPMMKHLVVLEKEYQDLPPILCFPMQLKQVFMNLLVNAYQAIEEHVRPGETGRIRLRTALRGGRVIVTVTDTGVGIAPRDLERIFDPFFTTKKVGSGTGLGLSTSYNIVRRHGGTIEVESVDGDGTTFRVMLPAEGGDG